MYRESILSKYVIINLDEWNTTTPYDRPSRSFDLEVPSDIVGARVELLTGPGADSMSNITWAGRSWDVPNGGLGTVEKNDTTVVKSRDGKLLVTVQSSEAVVVTLIKD